MSKKEFLESLRRCLTGGMESGKVNEHIRYYSDYIDSRIRMGDSEEEVMNSLGEPRLIAKTLLEMDTAETITEEYIDDEEKRDYKERSFQINGKKILLPGWLFTVLVCVICFFVLTFVIVLVTRLIPLLLVFMFIMFLYRTFREFFRR